MGPNKHRDWNMTVLTYTAQKSVPVERTCFAFQFTNLGDVVAFVNGMRINPAVTPATDLGDSRTVIAHEGDIYRGTIDLSFEVPTAGTNPLVEIVQLFYLNA